MDKQKQIEILTKQYFRKIYIDKSNINYKKMKRKVKQFVKKAKSMDKNEKCYFNFIVNYVRHYRTNYDEIIENVSNDKRVNFEIKNEVIKRIKKKINRIIIRLVYDAKEKKESRNSTKKGD